MMTFEASLASVKTDDPLLANDSSLRSYTSNDAFEHFEVTSSEIGSNGMHMSNKHTYHRRSSFFNQAKASIPSSVMNLIVSVIGAGTLGVPYAVAQTGYYIAGILFIFVAILNIITLNFNVDCAKELVPISSYNSLCNSTIPKLQYLVDISVGITIFGILCAYFVVIGDLLPDVVETFYSDDSDHKDHILLDRRAWITIYCIIFILPTVRLKKMDSLRFTSLFAILCFIYIMIVIILYASIPELDPCRLQLDTIHKPNPRPCTGDKEYFPNNYLKIFKAIPIYLLSYSCHFNSFSICNELENCTMPRLNIIICATMFICMLIYATVGFGAYETYGSNIDSNILLKYPHSNSLLILRIGLSIAIAFGYPVILFAARNSFCSLIFKKNDIFKLDDYQFYGLTYLIVFCSFSVSMITEDITYIFGIIGSTGSLMIVFVLPGLFYYNFNFYDGENSSKIKKYCALCFVIVGILFIPFCIAMQFIDTE